MLDEETGLNNIPGSEDTCEIRSCISGIRNLFTGMRASMWRMWRGIGMSNHFFEVKHFCKIGNSFIRSCIVLKDWKIYYFWFGVLSNMHVSCYKFRVARYPGH